MLNDVNLQSLEYLLSISNGLPTEKIDIDCTEEDAATALSYMMQLFDINSKEFDNIFHNVLNIQKYCSFNTLILVNKLNQATGLDEPKQIIAELVKEHIPGSCFKKYINILVTDRILRLRLLSLYKDYVEETIQLVKDKTIKNIIIF